MSKVKGCDKIYTNKVILRNKYDVKKKYIIQKKETKNVPLKKVSVNGKQIQYNVDNELLKITFEMKPNEIAKVEILYEDIEIGMKYKKKFMDNIKIMSRRYLSEARDNYICKSKFLRNFTYKLKGKFLL